MTSPSVHDLIVLFTEGPKTALPAVIEVLPGLVDAALQRDADVADAVGLTGEAGRLRVVA